MMQLSKGWVELLHDAPRISQTFHNQHCWRMYLVSICDMAEHQRYSGHGLMCQTQVYICLQYFYSTLSGKTDKVKPRLQNSAGKIIIHSSAYKLLH